MDSASAYPNGKFLIVDHSSSECSSELIRLLRKVKKLKKKLDCDGYYIAYLLGCITKKEYKKKIRSLCEKNKK